MERENTSATQPTAAVIVIGNEILSGRTHDVNVLYLGAELQKLGIILQEVRMVRDIEADIIKAVNELRAQCTYVFTTGGIGPTHDDITAASVAAAFGVKLHRHPEALERLQEHYTPDQLNEARLKMADLPYGAEIIENPVSRAPGFRIENVHVLAGVPRIMQAMFEQIRHTLQSGPEVFVEVVTTAAKTEGEIAHDLTAIQARFPDVEIGSYPYFKNGEFGVSLVLKGLDKERVGAARNEITQMLQSSG